MTSCYNEVLLNYLYQHSLKVQLKNPFEWISDCIRDNIKDFREVKDFINQSVENTCEQWKKQTRQSNCSFGLELLEMPNPKPTITVQKQLVRGTQRSTRLASVEAHTPPSLYEQHNQKIRTLPAAASNNDKYRTPQLQATMGLANQIDQFKAKTGPKYNDICDLTPRSRAVVTKRITHQLNFPTEATVFKKLIPVNVNDSVLEEICPKVKKRGPFTRHKDPEPVLGDYLTPVVPLELKIERCDSTIELKQPDSFDYNRMYSLCRRSYPLLDCIP